MRSFDIWLAALQSACCGYLPLLDIPSYESQATAGLSQHNANPMKFMFALCSSCVLRAVPLV